VGVTAGKTYTVEYSDSPVGGVWSKFQDILARPLDREEVLVDSSGQINRFYRLVTPRQP
jgi:hypothetical protein